MPVTHTQVSLRGFYFEDFIFTMILTAGITAADVGKAVSFGAAANTVKLAADGDIIIGRLATVENRLVEGKLVGSVETKFSGFLPIKSGQTVAAGDSVIGAGAGEVKKATTANHVDNFVAEVIGTNAVVVKI